MALRLPGRGGQSGKGAPENESAGARPKGRSAKAAPSRRQLLALKPVHNPLLVWEEEEGLVVLRVQHGRKGNWKLRLINILVPLPEERKVRLDAIGSDVWKMIDGQQSLGEIANRLAKKYKLEVREAELSVQQYFKDLGRLGYIMFVQGAGPEMT